MSEWRIYWPGVYTVHPGFRDKFEGTNAEFEAYVHYMMSEHGWRRAEIEHDANGRFTATWHNDHVHYSDKEYDCEEDQ